MQEVLQKVSRDVLEETAGELEQKSARFRALLAPETLENLSEAQYRGLLRSVFATRRGVGPILQGLPVERFRSLTAGLLYAGGNLGDRFQAFHDATADVTGTATGDLASELLHYTYPDQCWLWTRWMWDPTADTGALRLVTMEEYDLRCPTVGQTYLRVGEAVAFINSTGEAAGFTRFGRGLSGTHLYLACVYAVYMYTVLRMRMTQEFNQVVPQLPELVRRLLGVYRLEA